MSPVPELLRWWMTGPVAGVLCSPAGVPLVVAGSVAVLAVTPALIDGDGLVPVVCDAARDAVGAVRTAAGAASGRVTVAARHAVVTAALVVAVHVPVGPGVAR